MQSARYLTLHGPATITADTTTATVNIGNGYTAMVALLKVGTVSGTAPTLNCYIQRGHRMSDGTYTWADFISMTQLTASNAQCWVTVTGSGEEMGAASDAALAAGQIRNGPIPSMIRAKLVKGGTNPSFGAAELTLELIP